MYIPETTAQERLTIQDAVDLLFCDVERAARLLDRVLAQYFMRSPQQAIPDIEAVHLADMLQVILDAIRGAAVTYALTVGGAHDGGQVFTDAAADALESAERARKARQANDLLFSADAKTRKALLALSDDAIIEALTGSRSTDPAKETTETTKTTKGR